MTMSALLESLLAMCEEFEASDLHMASRDWDCTRCRSAVRTAPSAYA